MDFISDSIRQLAGFGLGVVAVTAVSLLTDTGADRADVEELNMSCAEALEAAAKHGTYIGGNPKGPIVLGCASAENSNELISALAGVGIACSICSDSLINIDLSKYLPDSSTAEEGLMYEDLISCGLILMPGSVVGSYRALRAHYESSAIDETARRFKSFVSKRQREAPPRSESPLKSEDTAAEFEVAEVKAAASPVVQTPAAAPPASARGTKPRTAARSTAGRGRKRKAEEDEDVESTQADDVSETATLTAVALKTPASRRKSRAVNAIEEEVTSTARKGRRRKAD